MTPLSEELRRLRQLKGLTLQESADAMKISKQYLSMLEQGKRNRISFETAIQISLCYEVSLEHLAKFIEL